MFQKPGDLGVIAQSFGAIYERNAINAGFPILTADPKDEEISDGDMLEVDIASGRIHNLTNNYIIQGIPFFKVQMEIYLRGGLLEGGSF